MTMMQTALDPKNSVWVAASAGAGKTTVLVGRVLRLLLSGSAPEKLLCITFTKAAAAEVLERIQSRVKFWSIAPQIELIKDLQDEKLLNRAPTDKEIAIARRLLPAILQAPGGMNVQTIHAFCQSILARFPIESGLPSGFRVADEAESFALLHEAKQILFRSPSAELQSALTHLYGIYKEDAQNVILDDVLKKRYRLEHIDKDDIISLVGSADFDIVDPESEILKGISQNDIERVADILNSTESKKNHEVAQKLLSGKFLDAFLTTSGDFRKQYYYGFKDDVPQIIVDIFEKGEANIKRYLAAATTKDTLALLTVSQAVLDQFNSIKKRRGVLDYDDQILKTVSLLTDLSDSQWVLFKLDNGIDHILVDEAQDTSPEQWKIVERLSDEFFHGEGRVLPNSRTLFVVGDEKQSIFGFQNADPEEFYRMRKLLGDKAVAAKCSWKTPSFTKNFRSSKVILDFVDRCFADEKLCSYLSKTTSKIEHQAAKHLPGEVTLWPLEKRLENDKSLYQNIRLAKKIVDHVQNLIDTKKAQAGDVMILARTRGAIVSALTKEFKDRNIPVLGADRLVLKDQIGVQDCLAALELVYHPHDDYLLACFLKSPFVEISENDLHDLCVSAGSSLWEKLSRSAKHQTIFDYCKKLVRTEGIAAFLTRLLNAPCPADERSGLRAMIRRLGLECADILDALIAAAEEFEHDHINDIPHFVTWIKRNERAYKEQSHDVDKACVRIMTVHASKGLQAPIVILADTNARLNPYSSSKNVLWDDHTFLWTTVKPDTQAVATLKAQTEEKSYAEYYRLLYVALTRAEQSLLICGVESSGKSEKPYPTWYEIAQRSLGTETTIGALKKIEQEKDHRDKKEHSIPNWMFSKPKTVSITTRPLRPSQPAEQEPAVQSPLQTLTQSLYQRGIALHHVFRAAPEYPLHEQESVIDKILGRYNDIDASALKNEALRILRHPDFSFLFTPQARSEVPLTGKIKLDGKDYAVSGQIDRLLVEKDRVVIVDYKTNRPPAKTEAEIPDAYRHQLRAYKLLLEQIYPDKRIECALLWTANAYFLPVSV